MSCVLLKGTIGDESLHSSSVVGTKVINTPVCSKSVCYTRTVGHIVGILGEFDEVLCTECTYPRGDLVIVVDVGPDLDKSHIQGTALKNGTVLHWEENGSIGKSGCIGEVVPDQIPKAQVGELGEIAPHGCEAIKEVAYFPLNGCILSN